MTKYLSFLLLLGVFCEAVCAADLPDNIYFRAMRDELKRTQKELRVKDGPKPFFTAYKIIVYQEQDVAAGFGAPYASSGVSAPSINAFAYMYAGGDKNNSSGFADESYYYYTPSVASSVPDSYEGARRILWRLSDDSYIMASDAYAKKEAYKRQKNIKDGLPDFTFAPKTSYVEEMPAFPKIDRAEYQNLVNNLSAMGKELPYLESFNVHLNVGLARVYFLDSEDDFYQYARPMGTLRIFAALRDKDGYKRYLSKSIPFAFGQIPDEKEMKNKTRDFLDRLQDVYRAKKAEAYLGPVLLEPMAAGEFFYKLFVRNANNSKPKLMASGGADWRAGLFKDKIGSRVISSLFDVYDRPHLKEYKGEILTGFTPVDDEGVTAQELQLVRSGKLLALPTVRSPIAGQKRSNGHARMDELSYPRAALTNVFFTPKQSFSRSELEQKLLDRCRELELEYCYIFPRFTNPKSEQDELDFAWRIYTRDGRKEPVYGLRLAGVGLRSLRDVLAAGDDESALHLYSVLSAPVSVVAPSVLVDEIEILPAQREPDKKPFVPLP